MIQQVNEVIASNVRPLLKTHHGDVEVIAVADGIVSIKLTGACSGCPHSDITTKEMIENILISSIEGIEAVKLIREIDESIIDFAKSILVKNK